MYCALKFPASLFFVCALRLEELSEPRTLLLGTLSLSLSHGLPRARALAHLRTHTRARVKGQCQNLTNSLRVVKVFTVKS